MNKRVNHPSKIHERDMNNLSRTISNNVDAINLLIHQAEEAQSAVSRPWLTVAQYKQLLIPSSSNPSSVSSKRRQTCEKLELHAWIVLKQPNKRV
jgi:hypothetical protein